MPKWVKEYSNQNVQFRDEQQCVLQMSVGIYRDKKYPVSACRGEVNTAIYKKEWSPIIKVRSTQIFKLI